MSDRPSALQTTGATLLIAGCCIGAGMLGLPLATAQAGFLPAAVLFFLTWIFMLVTGFLLLEVHLWFEESSNLTTMVQGTLGHRFELITWGLFLFLFYSIMVAYFGGGGEITADLTSSLGINLALSPAYLFLFLVGPLLFFGTKVIDFSNRLFTAGLILCFLLVVSYGMDDVGSNLLHSNWSMAYGVLPIAVISFGYHNLIPTLSRYLKRDLRSLRLALFIGTLVPFLCYLLWEYIILGISSPEELGAEGATITSILKDAAPLSVVGPALRVFTFCAIASSYVSVGLSCMDFLADGLKIEKKGRGRILLWALVVLPPFVIAQSYPYLFLHALGAAGAYGATVLYGIFPALMVWKGRYHQRRKGEHLMGGGKATLVAVFLIAAIIIGTKIVESI